MTCMTRAAACLATAFAASTASAQQLVLEPHTVRDAAAVHRDALTFLMPKGWKVSGGVQWYPNHSHQVCLEMKISNPKGLEQIETLPWCVGAWFTNPVVPMQVGQNYMGDIILPPMEHPKDVVEKLTLPQLRGKYKPRITGYQDMPELAKVLSNLIGAKVRSGKIRIEYAIDGQMVEEDIYLSLFVTSMNLGVNNCTAYRWGPAWPPFSLRAAKGQLDAQTPVMLSVINSARVNPRWFGEYMYVCDLFKDRMAKGIKQAVDISNTIRENSDAIFKMYSDSYWSRQRTQDRLSQNFSNYIRGVEHWTSPHERYPVQLPSGYRYAWTNSSGQYILSNEAGFDPNVGSSLSWTLMKTAR